MRNRNIIKRKRTTLNGYALCSSNFFYKPLFGGNDILTLNKKFEKL
jgi:hypothetical protein